MGGFRHDIYHYDRFQAELLEPFSKERGHSFRRVIHVVETDESRMAVRDDGYGRRTEPALHRRAMHLPAVMRSRREGNLVADNNYVPRAEMTRRHSARYPRLKSMRFASS